MDFRQIAESIYNAALDMDFADYVENKDEDVRRLERALEDLEASNENQSALLQALERIFA